MSHPVSAHAGLTIEGLCEGFDVPDHVLKFEDVPGGEVVFGPGKLSVIGEKASGLGATRVLLVTDPGLRKAGHEDRCLGFLRDAGLDAFVFDEVRENPTTTDVARCVEAARGHKIDLIVGLGGGSSMDTAKGANFILTNGGEMKDYWGVNKAGKPMLPMIAVPTTSGTGSECQSFALIAEAKTHAKMACGDKKAAAAVAILDPELTLTQPRSVTVHTGIDAISHALETAVCNKRSAVSLAYSRIAWLLLNDGFEKVLADPDDLEARARMQLGAAFAGTAIENSMLGIAHSCANPLTAHFGTVHGQAVGVMLPHTIRFNRQDPEIAAIYEEFGGADLDHRIENLLRLSDMKTEIAPFGVTDEIIPQLADEAAEQWTAQFNPVPVSADDLVGVFRGAL
ncbi:MAG: iron-containing alcohol dehydrogenase [Verrucomicrobiales bacterium]|nr:iron-containing alcohol dehydrogenase [Verrucomicrobiales bacterium]